MSEIASSGTTAPSVSAQRRSSSVISLRLPRLTKSLVWPWASSPVLAALAPVLAAFAPTFLAAVARALAPTRARGVLQALLGPFPGPDLDLRLALDAVDLPALRRGDERDRAPGAPDPPRAPDAVDVALGGVGHVVVDDVGDVLDVKPARGDVGRDQQPQAVVLERDHHAVAGAL